MHRLDYLDRDIHAIFDNSIVFSGKQQQQTIDSMTSPTVTRTFFSTEVCLCVQSMDKKTNKQTHFLMKMQKRIAKHKHADEQK